MCVSTGAHTTAHVGERTTFRSCFFLPLWVPDIEFGSSELCSMLSCRMRHLISTNTALFSANNSVLVTLK